MRTAGIVFRQTCQRRIQIIRAIADHRHVTACVQSRTYPLHHIRINHRRACHAQIIGDQRACELQIMAQHAQPNFRKPRRQRVHFRVNHMRGHDCAQILRQMRIGHHIALQNLFQTAFVNGHVHVRVRHDKTMSRKMLATTDHTRLQHTVQQGFSQHHHILCRWCKRTITNHRAATVIQIQYRCITVIHAHRAQFTRQDKPDFSRQMRAVQCIVRIHRAQFAHGRQMRETIGFKALYAPAFVVNTNDDVRTNGANGFYEFGDLSAGFKIAPEQNHPACVRMRKATFVVCGQIETCQIHNHRAQ